MLRITTIRKVMLIGLLTLLLTSQASIFSAGAINWKSNEPGGGDIRTMEIGPVTTTHYSGIFDGGVFAIQLEDKKYLTELPLILPWQSFNCDNTSEIPHIECEALVSLYNSTNGSGWAHQVGWLATNTPCSWYGVTCEAGHVQELYLDYNQLSGTIPSELGNLVNLQVLYLGVPYAIPIDPEIHYNAIKLGDLDNPHYIPPTANHLSGGIPPQLGNLTNLRLLALTDNQLSGAIPAQLGNLVNLQMLALEYNQLNGAIPPELGNLASLQSLLLSNNQLSGAIPPELGNLPDLSILALSHNQLSGAIPSELGNLVSLAYLVLNSNQLSGAIPPELGSLGSLELLKLHENQLSGAIPPVLGNLTRLYAFYLQRNQLSGALPRSLMELHLSWFYYNNTNLCEPPDAAFQAWLAGISFLERSGVICSNVYLPLCFR